MTDNPGTAIAEWNPDSNAALPAYMTGAMDDLGTNIADRDRVPSLSYEGKTWQIVKDGDRNKLTHTNSDGDVVPVPVMRMVVLNYNSERGRAFYEGEYDPSTTSAPKCWSADGKFPDPSVEQKQASACASCPMAVKGSKVRDGREMVACSAHRMLAIAPAFEIDSDPLRLKIAVTSDYDKNVVEHGWFAFRQYTDFLKSRGITHTGLVVTKVKFDNTVAYPKLLFAVDRLLTEEEVLTVRKVLNGEDSKAKIDNLLNEKWTPAGVDGVQSNDADIRPRPENPSHIHQPGTPGELWWDENTSAWVKPWETEAASPPPPQPPTPEPPAPEPDNVSALAAAVGDGWALHPENSAFYYKGDEVVAIADLEARYAGNAAPATTAPDPEQTTAPSPAAGTAPAPEPEPAADPLAAAVADGWTLHPENGDYHFKGEEVVSNEDLKARYAPKQGAAAAPATPAAEGSSAEVPADVKDLLSKWT